MKPLFLALGMVAVIAPAQTPQDDRARQRISSAYGALREQRDFSLTVWGTEDQPGRRENLRCTLFWSQSGEEGPKVEVLSYRNDVLTNRIVGDGATLWSHDLMRNEYSASRYVPRTAPTAATAPDPMRGLLTLLETSTRGPASYAARVLRDIQSDLPGFWRALPVRPEEDGAGDITYQLGDPARRWAFYDLETQADGSERLLAAKFYEASRVGSRKRELSLTLMPGPIEPDHPFTFAPPARARSVRG